MGQRDGERAGRGRWLALTAALLGWMFDGLEQGIFPLVGRPALKELLGTTADSEIGRWFAVATAIFLVGAATGGVLFGWLGDRIGRVRAMTLSVVTYALFTGLCGFCNAAWQIAVLRFLSALGMGGEWSLGVALVMEVWPERSRGLLAGLIGSAANVGYVLIGSVSLVLTPLLERIHGGMLRAGVSGEWADRLTGNSGWRLLMLVGAAPAVLTFFIRMFVPESGRWEAERSRGTTGHWATRDLGGVLLGAAAACGIIYLWAAQFNLAVRLLGSALALVVALLGFLYPVVRYLQRVRASAPAAGPEWPVLVRRMLFAACLSGVPLLGTWASIQWASTWADQLTQGKMPEARAYTSLLSGLGASLGTIVAAVWGMGISRRLAYAVLCVGSLGASLFLFRMNTQYGAMFLASVFVAGAVTASFYGWLPLYLPELFRTSVRATGQGFSYNFGRILAAVGVLQTGSLMGFFKGGYPEACSIMSLVYLVGLVLVWFAPETRGAGLPE